MGVPEVYRKSRQRAIATFDYIDIAEGTGTVIFFGYNTQIQDGTKSYHLGRAKVFSQDVETGSGDTITADGVHLDIDFADLNIDYICSMYGNAIEKQQMRKHKK